MSFAQAQEQEYSPYTPYSQPATAAMHQQHTIDQSQLRDLGDVSHNIILDTNEEVRRLAQEAGAAAQLFNEVAVAVHEQGHVLGAAEDALDDADDAIKDAAQNLHQIRCCSCCPCLNCCFACCH